MNTNQLELALDIPTQPVDSLALKRLRALEWLGERWLLHPVNQVRRIGA